MTRTQIVEAETRRLLHQRTTWMLLATWEVTETIRDTHDASPELVRAAVDFIDWTIDELADRYPDVLPRWHRLIDAGHDIDLAALFAHEYARSIQR